MTKIAPFGLTVLLAGLSFGQPAQACAVFVPRNPDDIRHADVVVIGKIVNYHIVLDQAARRQRQQMLANAVYMPPKYRDLLSKQESFLSDYAEFDVIVEKTILGKSKKILNVTWQNSTFGEPTTMPPGPYLIALSRPTSAPPLRGQTRNISNLQNRTAFTPVQAVCSSPFILQNKTDQDDALRRLSGIVPLPKARQTVR